jgi:hypothetical protein
MSVKELINWLIPFAGARYDVFTWMLKWPSARNSKKDCCKTSLRLSGQPFIRPAFFFIFGIFFVFVPSQITNIPKMNLSPITLLVPP